MKDLNRRDFLAAAGAGVVAAGCARSPVPWPLPNVGGGRPPNVIFAFSDEHRYQSMSFTETPEVQTPVMARMAAEGCSFTQCISNYPVCSPYRAMLMTGRWPYQTGIIDNGITLDPDSWTVGKTFQAAGYRTGYIGKWHLGGTRAEPYGFDTSLIWTGTNTHYDFSSYHPADGEPVTPKGYNATLMTDQALDFMDGGSKPFFLMLSWNPPHADFLDAPPEKQALYPGGSIRFRPNMLPGDAADAEDVPGQSGSPYYEGYHAHISAIDDELGRLIAHLERRGLMDNTILIYSSDHGSMQGSHGVGSKRQPHEESIRIPFLVHAPGRVQAGAAPDALFGAIDAFPTLCGLAGIPVPPACMGRDFSGWSRGETGPDPAHQLLMHISKDNASGGARHPAPIFRGLRTPRHTFAVQDGQTLYLFDNEDDPYQLNNLAEAPEHAGLRAELRLDLRRALRQAEDPYLD